MEILIIDDDVLSTAPLVEYLSAQGTAVDVATDGENGLNMSLAKRYDAVLVELMLPGMHGYEVIQRMRGDRSLRRVPILAHSMKIYESDQKRAVELGADAYLQKPLEPEALAKQLILHATTPKVTFWGVRGSIAAPGRDTIRYGGNTPSVSIQYKGETLILDAGTGIRELGLVLQAEAHGEPLDVHLLITHTHWDHIQGFPFFVPAYVPRNRVHVFGPRNSQKPLSKVLMGQMDPEYFPVALGDMAAQIEVTDVSRSPFQLGDFSVHFDYVNHPGVTLGYRIEFGGRVVTYAPDTEAMRTLLPRTTGEGDFNREMGQKLDGRLVALARDADLFIADAQYTPSDYEQKVGWGHSNCLDAVDVAIEAGVKRFAPFSHDPMHTDADVDDKLVMCQDLLDERGVELELVPAVEGGRILLTDASELPTST